MRQSRAACCATGPRSGRSDLESYTAVWQHYAELPVDIQRLADKAYAIWSRDPSHGSLYFKKLAGHDALWSVRIGRQYRALARRNGDLVVWVWIGHHSEYDRLVR